MASRGASTKNSSMANPFFLAAALLIGTLLISANPAAAAAASARLSDLCEATTEMRHRQHLRSAITAKKKQPPVWPEQLHAVLLQNRGGELADVDLYYDYPNGRNLNIIKSQADGSVLWDNERNNGSTYYYYPSQEECSVINFPVGILRPDWLKGAAYKGVEELNGHQCDVWAQPTSVHRDPPFITYYADVETQEPVRWVFFDGGYFDVQEWIPGGMLPDEQWQLPAYCFPDEEGEPAEAVVETALE